MKYQEWQKKANRFLAMAGYTEEKFSELLPCFKAAHDEYLSEYHMDEKRRRGLRAYTMYANSPLSCMKERLAFILSYLKLNPIQEALADMFGIEQKQCCQLIHGLQEILHRALEASGSVPAQTDAELQEVLSGHTSEEDAILLHDGTGSPPSAGRRSTAVEVQRKEEKTYGKERSDYQLLLYGTVYKSDI
jgi:hypothetical protein